MPNIVDVGDLSLRQIVHDFDFYSDQQQRDILDALLHSSIRSAMSDVLLVSPDPKDLFVVALSQLRDSGDIDVLVRALNWQHNDIAFLSHQLQGYERSLSKLDTYRKECARLRDAANNLRDRNSELIKALTESNIKIPIAMKKKIRVKPPKPRL